jgi:hypothetical protein
MKNQGAVVVASLMIIVLSFMFYLFSNQLSFFIIGIGMGLFILATAIFFLLSDIRDSMAEVSDAVEMNNVMIDASGRRSIISASDPGEPDISIHADDPSKDQ